MGFVPIMQDLVNYIVWDKGIKWIEVVVLGLVVF